jgi:hypothetical protein
MSDVWLRRTAWIIAFLILILLIVSAIMLALAPDHSSLNWLENQVKAIVTLGAPILGLIIVTKQPRHRVGWVWLMYGMVVGVRALGHGVYYFGDSQSAGYSVVEYGLLWSTEAANFAGFICLILLMLWFPDGHLVSRSLRFLYIWLFLATAVAFRGLFTAGPNWNGGVNAGGIVIDNPYGWLPKDSSYLVGFSAFISIVLVMFLAAISLVYRYRSARQLVRLQLRWFVLGGVLLIGLNFLPVFFLGVNQSEQGIQVFLYIISFSAILPLYLAVGIAILRYRLYDIDVIVRRTLVYAVLTALLALVYFGSIVLLQRLFGTLTGVEQSPLAVVISTLVIAALFTPLRLRIQDGIDRRFYRKKYDAQRVLARFALTARDETDLDALTSELARVVQETMQPDNVSVWIKR